VRRSHGPPHPHRCRRARLPTRAISTIRNCPIAVQNFQREHRLQVSMASRECKPKSCSTPRWPTRLALVAAQRTARQLDFHVLHLDALRNPKCERHRNPCRDSWTSRKARGAAACPSGRSSSGVLLVSICWSCLRLERKSAPAAAQSPRGNAASAPKSPRFPRNPVTSARWDAPPV